MKKTLITAFWIALTVCTQAQVSLNNMATESNASPCQPGVVNKTPSKGASFTYSLNPDYKMTPPDGENPSKVNRNERFDTKLKVPVITDPGFKFIIGLQYTLERYHFTDINPDNSPLFNRLNKADLKTAGIAAYFVRPVNHKLYTSFRLSASWQGDYASFISLDNRYAIYRAAGVLGIKKREDLEYGFGLLFTKSFRRTSLLPFGFYNQTFDEHWGLELALPVSIKGRYNFTERTIMLFGSEYSSQNYALAVKQPSMNPFEPQPEKAPFHYHRSTLDLTASLYQQLSGWTWIEVKGGYAFNLNSRAREIPANQTYDLKPSGSMVGMISFFISPPKHYSKED